MLQAALIVVIAAVASWAAIRAMFPLLRQYALARPNARSSHKVPTAQGGGAAVIAVALAVAWAAYAVSPLPATVASPTIAAPTLTGVSLAVLALAVLGAFDDIRPLPVLPRLGTQFAAAILLVWSVPLAWRALPAFPAALELAILVVGLVWFINLTNFMDGLDWMTVAEMVPVSLGLALLGALGALPDPAPLFALALAGALLGFAPYNRHVARLFLGDVGSLAIGALVGWMLVLLAAGGNLIAALLLPLYYLMDATVTLYRRWRRGDRLSEAHRSHFYQIATTRGFTVPEVTARVFAANVVLAILALVAVPAGHSIAGWALLAIGLALVSALLWHFERGPAPVVTERR